MVALIFYSTAKIATGLHGVSHPSLYIPYQLPRHVSVPEFTFLCVCVGVAGAAEYTCLWLGIGVENLP